MRRQSDPKTLLMSLALPVTGNEAVIDLGNGFCLIRCHVVYQELELLSTDLMKVL